MSSRNDVTSAAGWIVLLSTVALLVAIGVVGFYLVSTFAGTIEHVAMALPR